MRPCAPRPRPSCRRGVEIDVATLSLNVPYPRFSTVCGPEESQRGRRENAAVRGIDRQPVHIGQPAVAGAASTWRPHPRNGTRPHRTPSPVALAFPREGRCCPPDRDEHVTARLGRRSSRGAQLARSRRSSRCRRRPRPRRGCRGSWDRRPAPACVRRCSPGPGPLRDPRSPERVPDRGGGLSEHRRVLPHALHPLERAGSPSWGFPPTVPARAS